jgi:hypothetical protein
MVDWHIWLTKIQGAKEKYQGQAIVIEATPRVRARRGWTDETLKQLKDIVNRQTKVRISGWLFFDPEHPGNVYPTPSAPSQPEVLPTDISGKTRKTLWEIHPIMQIEVWQDGWITLDKLPKPTPKP